MPCQISFVLFIPIEDLPTSIGAGFARQRTCKTGGPVQVVSALNDRFRYTTQIQPIGLRLWRIGGDGRCLFRALVQGAHQLDKGKY